MFQIFTILLDLRILNPKEMVCLSTVSKISNASIKLTYSQKYMHASSLNYLFTQIGLSKADFIYIDKELYTFYIIVLCEYIFEKKTNRDITYLTHIRLDKLYPARFINNMSGMQVHRLNRQLTKNPYINSILNIATKPKKIDIDYIF